VPSRCFLEFVLVHWLKCNRQCGITVNVCIGDVPESAVGYVAEWEQLSVMAISNPPFLVYHYRVKRSDSIARHTNFWKNLL